MARLIEVRDTGILAQHAEYAELAPAVRALREAAAPVADALRGRTLWMVNSTARGGGVAEMLPGMIGHLCELDVDVRWVVLEAEDPQFFRLTKRIHNMIHGNGEPGLNAADRAVYEAANRRNAVQLKEWLRDGDILAVHDPQPMPLACMLRDDRALTAIWRCHIGLDETTDTTADAWAFLRPYAPGYQHAIFSAPEYVPPFLVGRSSIIYPAIDPLSSKNRRLPVQHVVSVLERAGLLRREGPRIDAPYESQARRLQPDGSFGAVTDGEDLGLLTRPIITQVSRWDHLKGFLPLMYGFALLKRQLRQADVGDPALQRRVQLARLVLAGPDPGAVADDPEASEVLEELCEAWLHIDPAERADIVILALPMDDPDRNALMVNALQHVSTVVVQNSLREGFGLTITEAMWKGVPVLSNGRACGPRQQVRDDAEGCMIRDPEEIRRIADVLSYMIADPARLERWGRNAQRRVHDHFLVYSQLQHWLRLVASVTGVAAV